MVEALEVRFLTVVRKDKAETCYKCMAIADKEVIFRIDDSLVIRAYCGACVSNAEY